MNFSFCLVKLVSLKLFIRTRTVALKFVLFCFSGYTESLDKDTEIVVPEDDYGLYAIDILDPSFVRPKFPPINIHDSWLNIQKAIIDSANLHLIFPFKFYGNHLVTHR